MRHYIAECQKKFCQQTGLDRQDAREIFDLYFKDLPNRLDAIFKALEAADFKQVRHLAHGLKGASYNLRLDQEGDLALALQEASEAHNKGACLKIYKQLEEANSKT